MSALATATFVLFIVAWCVGVASWFYAARYFLPMWLVGFRHLEEHAGYRRKVLIGAAVFVAAIAVGFAAGWVAEYTGADEWVS